MNGRLRADIDPLGRLIKNDDLGLCGEPLADHHLLLITARQSTDRHRECRSAQIQPLGILTGKLQLVGGIQKARA